VAALPMTAAERARAGFASALRKHVFDDLAANLGADYRANVAPRLPRGSSPEQVHRALRQRDSFRFYSSLRVSSQEMLYQVVRPVIERQRARLESDVKRLGKDAPVLHAGFPVPRSVSAIDIHLMPGSYCEEYAADDPTMGAVYEQRLAVSTFGLFGPDLDDIGQSIARFIARRHPHFRPLRILDLGCTVGHNTAAWKRVFPQAEVVGIDVAAPCLRYAALRARARGLPLRFEQMNAEALAFPDASFDVVFSSMFLHEVPPRGIARVLREAHRVLRPGGLMLHMELPPADQLGAFESFYLDWDGHYNNEPYYRGFRAMNLPQLCRSAGFAAADYLQHVVPSWHALGARAWNAAVDATDAPVDSAQTGRLASGVRWFCFGAWKGEASRRGRR
jgi:ubiquinone/menaquinone biosynthesis C-methylase UbiE